MNNDMKIFIKRNWKLILGILYLLSPLDILPDILPLIGIGDDALIAVLTLITRYRDFKKDLRAEEKLKNENIQEGEIIE